MALALDNFKVPYTYFGDQKLRGGNLRAKYDVIVYPHVGGSPQSQVNGLPMTGKPLPYKKTAETPNLGAQDESDDIRGGMGLEGLAEAGEVRRAGRHAHRGGLDAARCCPPTASRAASRVEEPAGPVRPRLDPESACSPTRRARIAYGYDGDALPVYFSQGPVLSAGRRRPGRVPARSWAAVRRFPGVGHEHHAQRRLPDR